MKLAEIIREAKNKHFYSRMDIMESEIDIRINEGRKYIEFDLEGMKEVVELKG